ncbi:MAG: hypothetical protein NVS9B15_20510 [Acidobacteriaceae bacterium]
MDLDSAVKYAQIFSYFAAVVGGVFAVREFFRKNALDRAEWKKKLFDSFYGPDSPYRLMRERLDCGSPQEIAHELETEHKEGNQPLTDYLNFLEFVCSLQKQVLLPDDMFDVFQYPLACLGRHPAMVDYICNPENSYGNLRKCLKKSGYIKD